MIGLTPKRITLVLGLGTVLAVAFSEPLREHLLDLLFGAEEEFDYTPITEPPPAANAA